ncbi:MAG: hypothetical protein BGO69_16950 [Bacteroidetes bacterium 46-16]|nr:MAG: hypothetical protein BGO69_16950 [Bacteroidetes bacterium 46-16]
MRKVAITIAVSSIAFFSAKAGPDHAFGVSKDEIHDGYVTKKIWLDHYRMPKISLEDVSYTGGVALPVDAIPADPSKFNVTLGKDRKRPFALISVPAYSAATGSQEVKQLSSFTAVVKEDAGGEAPFSYSKTAAKGTATNSPLASGTWYKISVSETGFYKIDYNLLSQMGVNPANINPANIRVFGNGGHMLPENNAIARPDGLTENAIWVNDGGDNAFNQGDYVVFYAQGPVAWTKDPFYPVFRHKGNLYDDKAYYFINFDAPGERVANQSDIPQSNVTVNSYNDYALHEQDLVNMGGFGKQWWGEAYSSGPGFTTTGSFTFDLGNTVDSAKFHIVLGSRSAALSNTFKVTVNGNLKSTIVFDSQAGQTDEMNTILEKNADFNMALSGTATVALTYQPYSSDDKGYLDYIEINTRRGLSFNASQFTFRDLNSTGAGNKASYQIANASSNTQVWDVTNPLEPVRMSGTLSGSTYSFSQYADTLHEFAALNSSQLNVPEYVGGVANQNLHGAGQVDLIIVTHPDFLDAANAIADFHRTQDNMRVAVATTPQVYNEFSSGSKDISAIRDFARMFYVRAGNDTTQMPRYLLLIGDASYDPKNRVTNNNDYVPIYESEESHYLISSFCNDDFFGFLDDNENISNTSIANTLDLGMGRFPVNSEADAMAMVEKIKHYKSPASLGPWRLQDLVVADNEDPAGPHMDDGKLMCQTVTNGSIIYNHTKVFLDALPTVSSPGGARCPQANKIINDQIYKGCFFVNYSGHGNTSVWSGKRILTSDDYNAWTNYDHLPFMVTATCDFGRFDQPSYVSAGEALVLKHNGGAIAGLTTTQLVYQYSNRILNEAFLRSQFTHLPNNKWYRFGDAFRIGKNETYHTVQDAGTLINFRKFALLGDPALLPDFPQYTVVTDSIKNSSSSSVVDTLSALGSYMVYGSVRGDNGEVLTDFNGKLYVSFYDKPRTTNVTTYYGNKSFQTQNNIIYKGKATVTNGQFSYAFIVPKDINYEFGKGKLSSYAENGITDAAGADTTFSIGGYSDNPVTDNVAPIVKPYIGDSLFKDGGITGPNTLLYVSLEDEIGINVSGNAVGHDLTAVMDGDIEVPYILNDYYETEPNTYQRGHVYFPLNGLSVGKHTIVVKAWDVNNNSGEGVVNFEVVDGAIVKVQDLINYPNPFKDVTHFFFEHNHPGEALDVEINIYSTAGVAVRKIRQSFTPTNSRSNEITWDGTSDRGAKLPAGVYVYRVNIATATGAQSSAYQKLVLLR